MSPVAREHSFDELAIGLASGSISRGRALRLMGAALVGGTLTSFGIGGVAAADEDRCSEGQTRCGERCVNLKTNERHCGSCRNRCGSNQTCCKGRCVNLKKNENHCGECFNRCEEGEECVSGDCKPSCIPNGEPCTEQTAQQCCSNSCSNNICCPADRVGLSNGTCAKPCDTGGECNVGCLCLPDELDPAGLRYFCGSVINNATFCASHGHCPAGQYCSGTGGDSSDGRCIVAC
jgi:Stigma-specific protein, Stig1